MDSVKLKHLVIFRTFQEAEDANYSQDCKVEANNYKESRICFFVIPVSCSPILNVMRLALFVWLGAFGIEMKYARSFNLCGLWGMTSL